MVTVIRSSQRVLMPGLANGLLHRMRIAGGNNSLTFQTNKSGLFNPSVTVTDGQTVTWDYGDGNTSTGTTANRTYPDGTTKTVTVTFENPANVTHLAFHSQSLVGTFDLSQLAIVTGLLEFRGYSNSSWNVTGSLADLPSGMTYLHLSGTSSTIAGSLADLPSGMTYLHLASTSSTITGSLAGLPSGMTYLDSHDTSSTITGSLADLPSGMTYLDLYDTSSTITGSLAGLPSGMTKLFLASTSSTITGSLADLPSGMTYLHLSGTSSTITGGAGVPAAKGVQSIQLQNTTYTQAQVDGLLLYIYTHRAQWTHATPSLNIGGTNPAPSGTYQDGDPPTTGKEYIYELANDPEAEGFNQWAITYTA